MVEGVKFGVLMMNKHVDAPLSLLWNAAVNADSMSVHEDLAVVAAAIANGLERKSHILGSLGLDEE
eukprot:12757299-Prorocentrum_lima.AAC.1